MTALGKWDGSSWHVLERSDPRSVRLTRMDSGRGMEPAVKPRDCSYPMFRIGPDGRTWATNGRGVSMAGTATPTAVLFRDSNIADFVVDADGNAWIATHERGATGTELYLVR